MTTTQTALRNKANLNDESILVTLPAGTLLYLNGQATVGDILWSGAQTRLGDSYIGLVQDGAVKHITAEEAQVYIDAYDTANATATPTATPTPTPVPDQTTGYYVTLGDDVPLRAVASSLAETLVWLKDETVVYVAGQLYNEGYGWHITSYDGHVGYVRADQLRKLNDAETEEYLDSLTTVTPTPSVTPQPYDPYADSSYGYVSASSVNFRTSPSLSATRIQTLRQYAFALILGSRVVDGQTWYNINYSGTVGWVDGRYFTVLNLTDLTTFLKSSEYLEGITNNSSSSTTTSTSGSSGSATQGSVSSVEDWNTEVWQNPRLSLSASYEPFNPYTTPTATATTTTAAGLTGDGSTVEPTDTFVIGTMIPISYDEDAGETQADNGWLGLAIGGVILLGGAGGVYAYALNQNKKRRIAARNAASSRRASQQSGQTGAGTAAGAAATGAAATTSPYTRRAVAAPPVSGTTKRQDEQGSAANGGAQQNNPYARPAGNNPYARPAGNNPYVRPADTGSEGGQPSSGALSGGIVTGKPQSPQSVTPSSNIVTGKPQTPQSGAPSAEAAKPANPYQSAEADVPAGTESANPAPRRTGRASRYQSHDGDNDA